MKTPRILHVDGDNFFASCEEILSPALRGRAVVVAGGRRQDGIVLSASRRAKAFGIKSGMAVFAARRVCGELVVCPARPDAYKIISARMFAVMNRFSPIPDNSRTLRVDKKFFSSPALTSRKPGFAASVLIFESQREFANPPDSAKPTSCETAALNSCQHAAPSASADKSKKPSSMDTGTTNGENRFITANIRAEIIL